MSLEAWGDEGAGESDGYVTDEQAQEMVDEAVADAIAPFLEMLREIDNSDMAQLLGRLSLWAISASEPTSLHRSRVSPSPPQDGA